MLQAFTTPILKTVVLGAVLVGGGIGAKVMSKDSGVGTRRLVLHAPEEASAIYLSAWDDGDVRIKNDGALRPITFEIRASVNDGCRWLGVETLEPLDDHLYAYDYSEYILECDEGAVPFRKTPRVGTVTVIDE